MKKSLRFSMLILLSMLIPIGMFAQTPVFINEFHYDDESTDANEGIEIAGPAGTDMTGWTLELYNGDGGASYSTVSITGTIPDLQNGFGTIWTVKSNIQNESPGGIALVNPSSVVIQFLSYEGSFTAIDGPASGMTSTDIGVSESSSGPDDVSIQLTGAGETYEEFTWVANLTATHDAVNLGQFFGTLPEPDNQATSFAAGAQTFNRIPVIWNDATGTNLPTGYLVKANTTGLGDLLAPTDGVPEEDALLVKNAAFGQESLLFVGLEATTTYYFKIWSYSNNGNKIDYKIDGTIPELSVTTNGADTIILFEDFELDPEGWSAVSDTGDNVWQPGEIGADGTFGSGYINGYGNPVNVDWLFTPPVNLDAWSNEVLTFYNRWDNGPADANDYLKLLYSTDYNGDGLSFNDATWTEIPFSADPSDETWFMTTELDLSSISGSNVYFAFKYRSEDDPVSWWVDEIMITGDFTGETTAPEWKTGYPKLDDIQETQLDVVVNINEAGKVYFKVQEDGDPAPNIEDVIASDSLEVMYGGQDYSTTITGLTTEVTYDVYLIAKDALGNVQSATVMVSGTTLQRALDMTYPVGGESFYVGDTVSVTWTSENIDSLRLYVDSFEGQGWNPIDDDETKIGANLGQFDVPVPLSAGVDSVRLLLADADDFMLSDSSGAFYLIDTIGPMIYMTVPEDSTGHVSILPKLIIYFNEEVTAATGNISIYEHDGSLVETIDVTGDQVETEVDGGYMVTIQASVRLENETQHYMLMDKGTFVDYKGNKFDGISYDTVWRFTTIPADIYFSEYIEGGGYNKAVEIYNPTGIDIDLAGYQIWTAFNGDEWNEAAVYQLGGILETDSVVVLCNSGANDEIRARSDSIGGDVNAIINHDGNDALGLFKDVEGNPVLMDVIGKAGMSVPNGYDVAGVDEATKDHTLIRKDFIATGNPDWESSAGSDGYDSEWRVHDKDYYENLGLVSPPSSTVAEIDSFVLAEQTGPAVIDSAGATVDIEVIKGTDLSSLVPEIYISERADVDPPSGESEDFSQGSVIFTVTAEDRVTTRDWTVTVTEAANLSSEKKILTFVLAEENKAASIDTTNHTVTAEVKYGTALTALIPTITVSAVAMISPESDIAQDFSSGAVTYTVTAQDESTQDWAVTVSVVTPVEVADLAALRAATADNATLYKVTGEVVLTGFMDYHGRKYLQDASAAIELDDDEFKAVTTVYAIGDGITGLMCTLENFYEWLEIHPVVDPGAPTSTGNTITPKTITIDDFTTNFDDHEAQLIRIDTVGFGATGSFGNGNEMNIGWDGDSTILKVNFTDTDLTGTAIPEYANVIGIAYWHHSEAKIVPRFKADVMEIKIIPEAVEDILPNDRMRVYPNPNSGMFTFELNSDRLSDLDIEIFSLNGKMVYRNVYRSVMEIYEQIDLRNAARGMYILRVRTNDGVSLHKLVIQ